MRKNAKAVVAAAERFRAAEGKYPQRLQDLVPRYLPAIPSAKAGAMTRPDFQYFVSGPNYTINGINSPGRHVLEYISVPPIGKSFYVFETKEWSFRD